MAKKAVIVGAGPGGLAMAMILSRRGLDVTVLEQKDRVGGRTSSIRENGFTFDLGPTFFLYPAVIEEIFRDCGIDLAERIELIKLDPHYQLVFENDDRLTASPDPDRMDQEFTRLSREDAGAFARFLEDNGRKFEAFRPLLERPFLSWTDLADPGLIRLLPFLRPTRSVEGDLRRFFRDERLRLSCSFQSKYLGMSPYTCPSIFTILSYLEYKYGIYHPRGGCGAFSAVMADAARELGADIRLGERVERIRFDGRRARAAVTDQGEYPCDALVINADFAHAMQALVPDDLRPAWSDQRLQQKKYSCSTFMMYLGINRSFPDLPHHNIFLSSDYQENLTDIERDHRLSENPSFYVCNPANVDPGMAPPGKSALYVLFPITNLSSRFDWKDEKDRFRAVALRQLAKLGIEISGPDIEYEKIITPLDWQEHHSVYKGAVFNLAHSLDQMLHRRPGNRFGELESVYLTGGGTHPGSGLPVIYESARISAELLLQDLGTAV